MADLSLSGNALETGEEPSPWAAWLAGIWVVAVLLAAVAVATGFEALRLALDLQRHLAGR